MNLQPVSPSELQGVEGGGYTWTVIGTVVGAVAGGALGFASPIPGGTAVGAMVLGAVGMAAGAAADTLGSHEEANEQTRE
jgi:hypothetical protein